MAKFALYPLVLALATPVVFAQEDVVEVGEVGILEEEVVPALEAMPSPEPRKPARPHLMCYPSPGNYSRIVFSGNRGYIIRAKVWISDPDEQLWCPEVEWDVNGIRSSHEASCESYDQIVAEEGEPPSTWSPDNEFFLKLGVGLWVIKVRLRKAGETLWEDSCEVNVR